MVTIEYEVNNYTLRATNVPAGTTRDTLQLASQTFILRIKTHEMPPYTHLNVYIFRILVNHGGILTDDETSEILAFFEREKSVKTKYTPTLDAVWRLLGWRAGDDFDALIGDADLVLLHQFLLVIEKQPSLKRNATYVERALDAQYRHPLFETLFDPVALGAVKEHIQFRLLQ